ncbi:hypothetical protein TSAR_000802 [Trichomalopsis sarcophagae]|uniref:Uncharacterized protein n=1 Tax=Trichomalopsis sarcophagae TaxID=543379 RepID=A0A232FL38_9HYME|nr:hypothetical protein TSAR_000802 [Trichomalopsis sarcophagae]
MEPNTKNLDEGGRESEAKGYRAAPPSQLEVEHPTAKPEGKSVKGNTAYNTLTRWITRAASTSKNLNSDPAVATTAGDSSQNLTEVVAGGSSGEPAGNPEPSQGGQVGTGVDLQQPPAGSNTRTDVATENLGSTTEKGGPDARDATSPSSRSAPSSLPKNLAAGSAGGDGRAPCVKRCKDADSTPPANQTARKRPNVEPEIMAARMVDPLTRAVVCGGYPDEELTHQQLALVSEAIQTEIDKIPNKPWPEFDDSFVKMRSIVVVASNAFSRD